MLKIIAVALLVIAALFFAMMALNYAPMSQSKYPKKDSALLLPNRTDVISVSISCNDERETITDKREMDDLFSNLSTVSIKSVFEVSDGLSGSVVYVFEDDGGFFIEQPYHGVFSNRIKPIYRNLREPFSAVQLCRVGHAVGKQGLLEPKDSRRRL